MPKSTRIDICLCAWALLCIGAMSSCNKDAVPDYQIVNEQTLYPAVSPNDTLKNPAQYAEQLYLQLYGNPITPDALADITCLLTAAGNEQAAYQLLWCGYLQGQANALPATQAMHQQPISFTENTYNLLLRRSPTAAEREWWVKYIETHPDLQAAQVYEAFTTAVEYRFY